MELSKRLRAVADLVTEGASVADIGTDHGYIPIWLVQNNRSPKAIAMDIRKGPLERAALHIQEYELSGRILTRQSDGLRALMPSETDAMIAAGMGGGLVIHILEDGKKTAESLTELILQPQSEISRVRQYLNTHGYRIIREDMVMEDGKYYPMMKAVHGEPEAYTKAEYLYGRRLLESAHPVLLEYLRREKHIKEEIASHLRDNASESAGIRKRELVKELALIEEAFGYYPKEEQTEGKGRKG